MMPPAAATIARPHRRHECSAPPGITASTISCVTSAKKKRHPDLVDDE